MAALQRYMGAKNNDGLWQMIIALMPPHDTYIEPFAGSAAIFARKARSQRSILIERDRDQAGALSVWLAGLKDRGIVEMCEADGLLYLSSFDPAAYGRVLLYADPPYLLSTRAALRPKRYTHDFTEADHRALALVLVHLAEQGVAIILSGYPSKLYDELYEGWNTRELQVSTRGGVRTEKLWFNFEPGAAHWSAFAGRNRTHRQQIKRKAARWAAKFLALPAAERQAVLAALLELDEIPRSRS